MDKSTVMKNYRFLALMLFAMVAGCVAGWFFPEFGHFIKPAGTVFINMMFCVVVPLVFASISNSVASVRSRKRAGRSWAPPCSPSWSPAPLPPSSCSLS
ncbi:MAG: cation:dicarboxylase symporter family transporter [Flavonifractor plautii]